MTTKLFFEPLKLSLQSKNDLIKNANSKISSSHYVADSSSPSSSAEIFIFASSSSSLGLVNLVFDVDTHQEN